MWFMFAACASGRCKQMYLLILPTSTHLLTLSILLRNGANTGEGTRATQVDRCLWPRWSWRLSEYRQLYPWNFRQREILFLRVKPSPTFIKINLFILMCMDVLAAYMSMHHIHAVSTERKRIKWPGKGLLLAEVAQLGSHHALMWRLLTGIWVHWHQSYSLFGLSPPSLTLIHTDPATSLSTAMVGPSSPNWKWLPYQAENWTFPCPRHWQMKL